MAVLKSSEKNLKMQMASKTAKKGKNDVEACLP